MLNNLQLKINRLQIEQVKYTKFLGLYIDDDHSWKHHMYRETRQLFTTLKIRNICELNQYFIDIILEISVRWYPGEVQLTRGIPGSAKKKKKKKTNLRQIFPQRISFTFKFAFATGKRIDAMNSFILHVCKQNTN